jgi:hypothetical protein
MTVYKRLATERIDRTASYYCYRINHQHESKASPRLNHRCPNHFALIVVPLALHDIFDEFPSFGRIKGAHLQGKSQYCNSIS